MKDYSNLKSLKKIKRALRRNDWFIQIRPLILTAILAVTSVLLVSCWETSTYTSNKTLVSQCKTELAENKWICAEQAISKISDYYVRGCIEWNIDEKKTLASNMSNNTVSDAELTDIDNVAKECLYYKETTKANWTSYPIFPNFVSSMAGSFAWNYMADSLFNNRMKSSNWYYVWGWTSSVWTTSVGNWAGKTTSTIQSQYKTNSWNVKSFKSASAVKSNWSIWTTGSKWGSSSMRTSSSPSSWGSTKSSSSFGWGSSSLG